MKPAHVLRRKGFSLLELMITLVILGILGAILMIKMNSSGPKEDLRSATRMLRNALTSAQNKALGSCHTYLSLNANRTTMTIIQFKGEDNCQEVDQSVIGTGTEGTDWAEVSRTETLPESTCILLPSSTANTIIFNSSGLPNFDYPNETIRNYNCHYVLRNNTLQTCRGIKIGATGAINILKPSEFTGTGCTCSACP